MWSEYKQERKRIEKRREKEREPRKLEELSGMKIKEILFDSDIHKWSENENENEFVEKINGKKDIIILIEYEQQNLFGGYIGNKIIIGEDVNDPTCYLFSLRKNGKYTMKQYFRNEKDYSYYIPSHLTGYLMTFGSSKSSFEDITLLKKEYSSGYCAVWCYDYQGESFALAEKQHFNIKRIVVHQLQ